MKKIIFFTLLIFNSILQTACNKNAESEQLSLNQASTSSCIPHYHAIKSLESEYGCTNTKYQMNINLRDTFVIINSQVSFNSQVTGSCMPTIDFAKYDLLIGKKQLTSGNQSIDYTLFEDCINNKYKVTATFNSGLTAIAPNITYHLLIPKLLVATGQTVELTQIIK